MRKGYKIIMTIDVFLIVFFSCLFIINYIPIHTVIYDTKGGTIIASKSYTVNSIVPKPADPVMQGYVFDNWYIEDSNEVFDFSKPLGGSVKLTARWIAIEDIKE